MFELWKRIRQAVTRARPLPDRSYEELLSEGRRRVQHGDLDGAIQCYRAAQQKATEPHVTSTIEQHLRLPITLQKAGRIEEAEEAFRRLLEEGYPGQLDNPSVIWEERSIIYGEMSAAYQREGEPLEAAVCAARQAITDAYSRFLDDARADYEQDMERLRSREWATAIAAHVLKTARADSSVSTETAGEGRGVDSVADLLQEALGEFGGTPIETIHDELGLEIRQYLAQR